MDEPPLPSGIVPSVDNESTDVVTVGPCVAHNEGPPALPAIGSNLKDWIPSRGRDLSAVLYMAAGGSQPAGDALPSLLPSPILTMEDHVNFSTILNPIKDLMGFAIPKSSWEVGKELCAVPKTVIEGRLSALKFLSDMSQKLEEQNRRWVARLPEGSPSTGLNFALIQFLCSHLDYPDSALPDDLTNGMPVVGPVPDVGGCSGNASATPVLSYRSGATAFLSATNKWLSEQVLPGALLYPASAGKRLCAKSKKVGRRNLFR